jgi:hypothetical protein
MLIQLEFPEIVTSLVIDLMETLADVKGGRITAELGTYNVIRLLYARNQQMHDLLDLKASEKIADEIVGQS